MIAGIGTDIVEIARIKDAVTKWGDKFLKRIYSESELAYCFSKKDPFPNLAARFAAKEAAVKALSGMIDHGGISVGDIKVMNEKTGKPFIILEERLKSRIPESFIIHLSISHERGHAIATVIAERT